jgi:hypothetical protein
MEMRAKQPVSFRAKAAELRATAESYGNPELRTGILEIADSWEELAHRIEADGAVRPTGNTGRETGPGPEPLCTEGSA